jgi:hypothetical protein
MGRLWAARLRKKGEAGENDAGRALGRARPDGPIYAPAAQKPQDTFFFFFFDFPAPIPI